ncbi:MAG: response regulator [Lachnospiraceae bacterium]|nr:response regulator [Lachnospiraceae bacterium]
MYKVVIIDDEPIIMEGLRKSVDWNRFGCTVVGMTGSGEEGIRLIREVEPDIIFTDIRMPCMDGLTMIAAIRSEFPGMQIVILTGYRDFDYAQRAISLGVTRFLLKPSKMDEIMEALEAATDGLAKRIKVIEEIEEESEENGNISPDGGAGSFLVKNAVSYIEEHCKEKLKLSDVAEQVYVSQWHLSKLLNRYLGQNFSEILNGIRIEKAKEKLKDPSLRIGDIAEEVGFSDMAHFSRVFKKLVGISANEYRNKL